MRKLFVLTIILSLFVFTSCVTLTGPGFDIGDGDAKYDVAGEWEVRVLCDDLSSDVVRIKANVTQDKKILDVKFEFGGQALSGRGYVSDQDDIWMGGSHSGVAKAELEGKIVSGTPLTAEGMFWFQKIGGTTKYGTFTAKMVEKK